jgi:organic radical activating enzyme
VKYPVAERFVAPQGEGLWTGVPMAFVRLIGCSVGKKICTSCDTDFDRMLPDMGGGLYDAEEIVTFAGEHRLCLTGGEPLDRDIRPILNAAAEAGVFVHVETSGTVRPWWLDADGRAPWTEGRGRHFVTYGDEPTRGADDEDMRDTALWVTVSPKPGFRDDMILLADELKVIHGGLGDGPGWPDVEQAQEWAETLSRPVYLQPRNDLFHVNGPNLQAALREVVARPPLRLSVQLHKFIRTR